MAMPRMIPVPKPVIAPNKCPGHLKYILCLYDVKEVTNKQPKLHFSTLNMMFCFASVKAVCSYRVLSFMFQKSSQKLRNRFTELKADLYIAARSSTYAFLCFFTTVGSSFCGFLYSLKQFFSRSSSFRISSWSSLERSISCFLSFYLISLSFSAILLEYFIMSIKFLQFRIRNLVMSNFVQNQVSLKKRNFLERLQIKCKNKKYKGSQIEIRQTNLNMPPATSPQDLSQALETLQQSLYVLFMHYKGYIKAIFLFFFIYLFYKLGNLSVKDQILGQKQKLAELIDKRISIRVQIPKKIERMRKINKFVLFLTVVLLIGYVSGFYFKYKPIIRNSGVILILLVGGVISVLTALNIYKFYLNRKFRQNDNLERVISKKLNEFTTELGPKVNSILKNHLCKEKFQKLHSSMYSMDCQKPDCKQLRSLYKTRNQAVQSLVDEVINFQWCSICKKRVPFDEYLAFQYRQFQQKGQTEDQQVKNKMYYLVEGIQRMRKWLSQTSPCNCSKLYWHLSTNKIIEYKKTIKITEARTKQLQRKNKC